MSVLFVVQEKAHGVNVTVSVSVGPVEVHSRFGNTTVFSMKNNRQLLNRN